MEDMEEMVELLEGEVEDMEEMEEKCMVEAVDMEEMVEIHQYIHLLGQVEGDICLMEEI